MNVFIDKHARTCICMHTYICMDAQECAAGMCYSIHSRRVINTYAWMHRSVRQAPLRQRARVHARPARRGCTLR